MGNIASRHDTCLSRKRIHVIKKQKWVKVNLVKNVYEISIYLLTAHFPTLTKTVTILQFGLRISQEITDESSSLEVN